MKHRVHARLAFDDEKDAKAFMEIMKKDYINKSVSLNEDKQLSEISYCYIEECYHDEVPPRSCVVLEKWEVKSGISTNTVVAKVK